MLNISQGLERETETITPLPYNFGAQFCWGLMIRDKRPEREADTLMAGGWAQRPTEQ